MTQQLTTSSSGVIALTGGALVQYGSSHTVSIGAGISINNGGSTVIGTSPGSGSTNGAWQFNGTVNVSSGTLSFDNSAGSSFINEATGVWQVSGGTLNLAGGS